MNIVLIGYRCSGKTSAGKIIAREMGRNFVDTDVLIAEKVGSSIQTFVSANGWDRFRKMEKETVKEICSKESLIIATGGGVVLDEENVVNLKRNGRIFWLDAGGEAIRGRMEKDQRSGNVRPPLSGTNSIEEVEHLLNARRPFYEKASDFIIDTTTCSTHEVADLILTDIRQLESS